MSSMKEDHGREHANGDGGSGVDGQPRAPAPRREPTTPQVPPIPLTGPVSAGPLSKTLATQDDLDRLPTVVGSQQLTHPPPPARDPRRPVALQGSFGDVVQIVERSAMPEPVRREVLLELLRKMSPTLHELAVSMSWDSRRIAQALSPESGNPLPSAAAPERGHGGGGLDHALAHGPQEPLERDPSSPAGSPRNAGPCVNRPAGASASMASPSSGPAPAAQPDEDLGGSQQAVGSASPTETGSRLKQSTPANKSSPPPADARDKQQPGSQTVGEQFTPSSVTNMSASHLQPFPSPSSPTRNKTVDRVAAAGAVTNNLDGELEDRTQSGAASSGLSSSSSTPSPSLLDPADGNPFIRHCI